MEFPLKLNNTEREIFETVLSGQSISTEQALYLYEEADLNFSASLATTKRKQMFGNEVYYNKNLHIEVTNTCVNKCKFCSFYRNNGDKDAWDLSESEIIDIISKKVPDGISEVHFTGGLHPKKTLPFYTTLFKKIKSNFPYLHIKAFTSVEIEFFSIQDNADIATVLTELKASGMDSLAGGGAEILNDNIRKVICPGKTDSKTWLEIHEISHNLGMKSNCTMLYGHIETYSDRIEHMQKLSDLQNKTGGFNCFIPLKYKIEGNKLGLKKEISIIEELKNYAVSRLFLTNIPHLKAYWPMCGIDLALLAISFGADDFDGTIYEGTKIYSMAGAVQKPSITEYQIKELISSGGYFPVERDSLYNKICK